jgi:hypothetical protein
MNASVDRALGAARRRAHALTAGCAALLLVGTMASPAAAADRSVGRSVPWVVTLGDSAISGEAGRWAGNTEESSSSVDALGPTAYDDNGTSEQIPGCHRSRSAEAYIAAGFLGLDLACSGARSQTIFESDGSFKPGLDFYHDTQGREGQAEMLQDFASTHNVKAVVVLIGANNYQFSNIVQTCVLDWYFSASWDQRHCQDDATLQQDFSPANYAAQVHAIALGLLDIRAAMANAGYTYNEYSLILQTYSTPIPVGAGFRYPESGPDRGLHGCAIWNADADWVNNTVVPAMNNTIRTAAQEVWQPNMYFLDDQQAMAGHQLCQYTDGLLEDENLADWHSPGAADRSEWIQQVRTLTTLAGPYQLQEDGHPDYWGQLALRNCLRQAVLDTYHGGTCTPAGGLDSYGEPQMNLRQ